MGWDECFLRGSDASLEELRCSICTLLVEDAVFAPGVCQDTFCERCIQTWLQQSSGSSVCPLCRLSLKVQDLQPHRLVRRLVLALPAKCPEPACTWQGLLSELRGHCVVCECAKQVETTINPRCHDEGHADNLDVELTVAPIGAAQRHRRKKKHTRRRRSGAASSAGPEDDDDMILRSAMAQAARERRWQLAEAAPITYPAGRTPVELDGIDARVLGGLLLAELVRVASVSRGWRHASRATGLELHPRFRMPLGFGISLIGVRPLAACTSDQDSKVSCAAVGDDGLLQLADTATLRWARWFAAMSFLAALLESPPSVSAVSVMMIPPVPTGTNQDVPQLKVSSLDPLQLPVSFIHTPLSGVDIEVGCALMLRLFVDGSAVLARSVCQVSQRWSPTPHWPLQHPRFDGQDGEVSEAEGRANSALRVFTGAFVIASDAPAEVFSEWTLQTPHGDSLLRAGSVTEGALQWWLRGHQQVGPRYWSLDVHRSRSHLLFKLLECGELA